MAKLANGGNQETPLTLPSSPSPPKPQAPSDFSQLEPQQHAICAAAKEMQLNYVRTWRIFE